MRAALASPSPLLQPPRSRRVLAGLRQVELETESILDPLWKFLVVALAGRDPQQRTNQANYFHHRFYIMSTNPHVTDLHYRTPVQARRDYSTPPRCVIARADEVVE
jgi:hypothetical protein